MCQWLTMNAWEQRRSEHRTGMCLMKCKLTGAVPGDRPPLDESTGEGTLITKECVGQPIELLWQRGSEH